MKPIIWSVVGAAALIGGALALSGGGARLGGVQDVVTGPQSVDSTNIYFEGDTQVIEIDAKGGYRPRANSAVAGVPTVIRMKTRGTFDCSAAFTIPKIGYSEFLPRTGTTDIPIPPQEAGSALDGLCSMGMYSFKVSFE